jgi:hypothetical protein
MGAFSVFTDDNLSLYNHNNTHRKGKESQRIIKTNYGKS